MCFSQFAQFEPRPTYEETVPAATRPEGAPLTQAEQDPNLYGPIPMPPEWRVEATSDNGQDHVHEHSHNNGHKHATNAVETPAATVYAATNQDNGAATSVTSVTTQTLEAVVVELANGTRLLICPL
ncbi:hypothetical protein ACFLV7_05925 [Chloroflexota bacterium]